MTDMIALPRTRMTVDQYLAWAQGQPGRYELLDGVVFAMSPEGAGHAERKAAVHAALLSGIRARGVPCYALPDGMTVRIDESTAYEPDALVYCGTKLPPSAIEVANPVIVVEVLSPSTRHIDLSAKLADYFPLAQHCALPHRGSGKTARAAPYAQQRRDHSHAHRDGGEHQA